MVLVELWLRLCPKIEVFGSLSQTLPLPYFFVPEMPIFLWVALMLPVIINIICTLLGGGVSWGSHGSVKETKHVISNTEDTMM